MILTENIISFIPQRAPFVLIDELLEAGTEYSKTSFDIQEDHLFVCNNVLTEPGIVENMAQTAAAGIGYHVCSQQQNLIGFIGAIKSLIIDELPKVGEQIVTEVAFLHRRLNAYIVEAAVYLHERKIASCEFRIFVQEKDCI
jgi:3-hydroxyacyl-[acyl-carrier-protein] dehydratase